MSEHLEKAKAALEAARAEENASMRQLDLLNIARTQAAVAQAEASDSIADSLKRLVDVLGRRSVDGLRRTGW